MSSFFARLTGRNAKNEKEREKEQPDRGPAAAAAPSLPPHGSLSHSHSHSHSQPQSQSQSAPVPVSVSPSPVSSPLTHSNSLPVHYSHSSASSSSSVSSRPSAPVPLSHSSSYSHPSSSSVSTVHLDDICRLARSDSVNDHLTAAKLFNEYTALSDSRGLESFVSRCLRCLVDLIRISRNPTVLTHCIQSVVFVAKAETSHPALFELGIIPLLISHLDPIQSPINDLRVAEAALAALTHLARRENTCNTICELGLAKIISLLKQENIGVECNCLALLGALAAFPRLLEQLLEHDVLTPVYQLRDSSQSSQGPSSGRSDVLQNARYCLKMLGFSDRDPTAAHSAMVEQLISMGFPRGHCEAVIRRLRLIKSCEPDMQTVMGKLLDEPPPVLQSQSAAAAAAHENRDKEPSISRSQSAVSSRIIHDKDPHPPERDEKQPHGLSKEDKAREKARVENERAAEVQNLIDMGFPRKHAVLALVYNVNFDRAIEWLFEIQSKKDANRKAKKSFSVSIQPPSRAAGELDSDLESDHESPAEPDRSNSISEQVLAESLDAPSIIRNLSSSPGAASSSLSAPAPLPLHHPHHASQSNPNQAPHLPASIAHSRSSSGLSDLPVRSSMDEKDAAEMLQWLTQHGFAEYSALFLSESMTRDTLSELTEHDLERMGITALGPRKRILRAIRADFGQSPSAAKLMPPSALNASASPGDLSDSESSGIDSPAVPSLPSRSVSSSDAVRGLSSSRSGTSLSSKGALHFAFLQAMPLKHSELPGQSKRLDLSRESQSFHDALNESGRKFRCVFEVATKDNLLKMMTYARALHISGHGDPKNLVFENGLGDLSPLDVDTLAKILNVAGTELKFVFVSSCYSSRTALAFAAAGVPHVIAVQEDTGISDTSARAFASHVYLALMQGLSVADAFNKGRAAVIAANTVNPPCCCAHLHQPSLCASCDYCRAPLCCKTHVAPCHAQRLRSCCHPDIPHDESLKFLLLPPEADHSEKLFPEVEDGQWINKTPPKPLNNLPSLPDHFMGRARDALVIVPQLLKYRLYTITGERGIGKSALARSVATFINDRRHFHATYLLRLGELRTVNDIYYAAARALRLEIKDPSASPDQAVLEHLESFKHENRHILFVFDDCDQLIEDKQAKNEFRRFLRSFLDDTPSTVLITATKSVGNVDGHTQRVYTLKELHPLDAAALFVNRLPRELTVADLKTLDQVKSLQDLLSHPLLIKISGNPRLIEFCAELLNFLTMEQLASALNENPAVEDLPSFLDSPLHKFPDPAKGLLRACLTMLADKQREQQSHSHSNHGSLAPSPSTSAASSPLAQTASLSRPSPSSSVRPLPMALGALPRLGSSLSSSQRNGASPLAASSGLRELKAEPVNLTHSAPAADVHSSSPPSASSPASL